MSWALSSSTPTVFSMVDMLLLLLVHKTPCLTASYVVHTCQLSQCRTGMHRPHRPQVSPSEFCHGIVLTLRHTCYTGKPMRHMMRSITNWFAEFCDSQCTSHFATIFIAGPTEASIAERSHSEVCIQYHTGS